jgi:tRNA A-37 threonylcarbamoyl transferase component Bud32
MSARVEVHPERRDRMPDRWRKWPLGEGRVVARSPSTETRRVLVDGLDLHVKRHRYTVGRALKAALRHTLLRRSRAESEYRHLEVFRARLGLDAAPLPVAFGERRILGLLLEDFLATETLADAAPIVASPTGAPAAALVLGRFLRRLHDAGLSHGRLFARNLLAVEGGFAIVDLDRARALEEGRGVREAARAKDLAFLDESLPRAPLRDRRRALRAYLGGRPSRFEIRRWLGAIDRWRPEARRRLERRGR